MSGGAILFLTIAFVVLVAVIVLQVFTFIGVKKLRRQDQPSGKSQHLDVILETVSNVFGDKKRPDKVIAEVINCKTQEQYDHVLSVFASKGWSCAAERNIERCSQFWNRYEENTTLDYKDGFRLGDIRYAASRDETVLSYEEFLKREGLEALVKEEIQKPKVVLANPKAAELSKKKPKKPAPKKPVKRPSKK